VSKTRFTPGWGEAISEQYWSYSFLWFLDGKHEPDAATFEQHLQAYYTGLIGRNIERRQIPKEKLFPVFVKIQSTKPAQGDAGSYEGTIHMLDYMEQKPIVLNCLIHVRSCPGRDNTFVFYEISPQPRTHPVWDELDHIWSAFNCDHN
jgi:hypothetical protein